jgi:pilus assembly protein CpaC
VAAAAAFAQEPPIQIDREVGAVKTLVLEIGQNRLLMLSQVAGRVSVAEPRIADFKVITQNQLLLTAREVGTTDLTLWDKRDQPYVIGLTVTRSLEGLRKQIKEFFPGEDVTVSSTGDLVVLSGTVSDVRIPERLGDVARLHADKVVNLVKVSGNHQVQIEVKFAEVSRRGLRAMSLNFFHIDGAGNRLGGIIPPPSSALSSFLQVPGTSVVGPPPLLPPANSGAFSLFFSNFPTFPFSTAVSLLETTGLAKVLAEPTLVAMSGQPAKFLAGGEFPIPFAAAFGTASIIWKRFGIILEFTPTVIGKDTIQLALHAEVSDIDPARQVTVAGFTVPGLTSRQSETTVRLADGQSFAIAGLLSNQIRSQISKVPLLGDIPILGALFRSVDYRRDESELLVVVTARLARPLAPHEVPPLPTDYEMNDPGDFALFLLGSENASPPPRDRNKPASGGPQSALPLSTAHSGRGPAGEIGFIR